VIDKEIVFLCPPIFVHLMFFSSFNITAVLRGHMAPELRGEKGFLRGFLRVLSPLGIILSS
jgi:hypothetical protein